MTAQIRHSLSTYKLLPCLLINLRKTKVHHSSEKRPHTKPLSPSDDENYAETEQPGYQCFLLLFFICSRGYYSLWHRLEANMFNCLKKWGETLTRLVQRKFSFIHWQNTIVGTILILDKIIIFWCLKFELGKICTKILINQQNVSIFSGCTCLRKTDNQQIWQFSI